MGIRGLPKILITARPNEHVCHLSAIDKFTVDKSTLLKRIEMHKVALLEKIRMYDTLLKLLSKIPRKNLIDGKNEI